MTENIVIKPDHCQRMLTLYQLDLIDQILYTLQPDDPALVLVHLIISVVKAIRALEGTASAGKERFDRILSKDGRAAVNGVSIRERKTIQVIHSVKHGVTHPL